MILDIKNLQPIYVLIITFKKSFKGLAASKAFELFQAFSILTGKSSSIRLSYK